MNRLWNLKARLRALARAFSGDSVLVDCFAYARNDPPPTPSAREGDYLAMANFGGAILVALIHDSSIFITLYVVKTAPTMCLIWNNRILACSFL